MSKQKVKAERVEEAKVNVEGLPDIKPTSLAVLEVNLKEVHIESMKQRALRDSIVQSLKEINKQISVTDALYQYYQQLFHIESSAVGNKLGANMPQSLTSY